MDMRVWFERAAERRDRGTLALEIFRKLVDNEHRMLTADEVRQLTKLSIEVCDQFYPEEQPTE